MIYLYKASSMLGLHFNGADEAHQTLKESFMNHISEYGISYGTREEWDFRFDLFAAKDKKLNEINTDP